MSDDWTLEEVEATVADYFAMLYAELRGERYNKSEHRRRLQRMLRRRTNGSIERKRHNISAVLWDLGHPWIDGYKPLGHYQGLLAMAVAAHLDRDGTLAQVIERRAMEPATTPSIQNPLDVLEPPPIPDGTSSVGIAATNLRPYSGISGAKRDYLAMEARNSSLGRAGEEFVLEFEARRLHERGARRLADRIEHVSVTRGDGLGYDILSFEATGQERLIEVKTTSFGKLTPFYVTRNELACSQARTEEYFVYRLHSFRKRPRLFTLAGDIETTCRLDPSQFIARVA